MTLNPSRLAFSKSDVFRIEDLPEPSHYMLYLKSILQKREIDFLKLTEAINADQAMATRILKLINSSYYGLRDTVKDVGDAVTLLGVNKIKNLVYSSVCFNFFSRREREEWEHAYTTSLLITDLIREYQLIDMGNLQLLALMHDIGKVVMNRRYRGEYHALLERDDLREYPAFMIERTAFRVDHSDVGAWLLEAWDFPEDVLTPIFFHHMETLPEDYPRETALLKLADWIDNMARDKALPKPDFDCLEHMGIPENHAEDLVVHQIEVVESIDCDLFDKNAA